MKSFTELAANIGGFALFRAPDQSYHSKLYYVDHRMQLIESPWHNVPTEAEVCQFLGIPPWDDMPLPILSYIEKMQ